MTHIAAIPTLYNGVQFRSRLEARWAAFFDLLGWQWEYEPFDLNGWIPDFRTMHQNGEFLVLWEIKPTSELDTVTTTKIDAVTGKQDSNYDLALAGFGPKCMWFHASWCPEWARRGEFSGDLLQSLEMLWKTAGNAVQWRSPVPGAHPPRRATAPFPDFKLFKYADPTETYEWLIDYYKDESRFQSEWADTLKSQNRVRAAVEAEINSIAHSETASFLKSCEQEGILLSAAKKRCYVVLFQRRAAYYGERSARLTKNGSRPDEAVYYYEIQNSALLKADAIVAKNDSRSDHVLLNADAETAYKVARDKFFRTDEGRLERLAELSERIDEYYRRNASHTLSARAQEYLESLEAEFDYLDHARD